MNHGRIHLPNDSSGATASDPEKRSLRSRQGQPQVTERLTATSQCAVNATRDVLTVRLSRNGVDEALLGRHQNHSSGKLKVHPSRDENAKASSSGTASKSDDSESDEEVEDQGKNPITRNHPASSYTSGSTGKNDASEDDDDDDTEDETDGSDTETYSNRSGPSNKRLRSSATKTEAQSSAKVRRRKSDSPKVRAGYRTRNQGRRTIQYTEQDDEEDDAGDKNALGVSSRGRPQRPNVRLASMIRH